jgi:hypothetical protein
MSNIGQNATPDQLSIDDQLIALVRVARALRYDDAAEWIPRHAMAQAEKVAAQVSDPPASEPSRTDAVREAIARDERHAKCGGGSPCRASGELSCFLARRMRPLLAALADAERKLADERAESSRAWGQCNSLHAQIAMIRWFTHDAIGDQVKVMLAQHAGKVE